MFKSVKRIFDSIMMFFGGNLSSVNLLECVSMNNQECKVRPEIVNVNSNEHIFYRFSNKTSVVVVTISMKPVGNCVFLLLLKT